MSLNCMKSHDEFSNIVQYYYDLPNIKYSQRWIIHSPFSPPRQRLESKKNAQEKLLDKSIDKVESFSFPKTLSPLRKVAMLLFNMIPAFQVVSFIAFIYLLPQTPIIKLTLATTLLLLIPPLTSLLVLRLSNIKNKTIIIGSNDYLIWWFLLCQQTLFSRLSFLEECIRMIPGLYSLWLRLWGSQIGSLTYWAPGTRILDRGF